MHIRLLGSVFAVLTVFFSFALPVSANVTILSTSPTHSAGPFSFYCTPYATSFVDGNHYTPTDGPCVFSLPSSIGGQKIIAVYKGVPGSATLLASDAVSSSATLVQEDLVSFGVLPQDQDLFAVVWNLNLFGGTVGGLGKALASSSFPYPAGAVLGSNYYILAWKWAVPTDTNPPVITITSPVDGASYYPFDFVPVVATIVDPEGFAIGTTVYTLNGAVVDPLQPLPVDTLPFGPAVFVIGAMDAAGNTGYATSTFTVLDPNPPTDTTPPVITITNPIAGNTYYDNQVVFLTATISDDSALAATSYAFNGNAIDQGVPLPLLGAPLGLATVSVAATDEFGNAASSTITFFIQSSDVLPPTITITNPINGATYPNTASVIPAATISDPSGIAVSTFYFNGNEVDRTLPLPLSTTAAGTSTLRVSATDNFGNAASSSIYILVTAPPPGDTQGPVITILKPENGKIYHRSEKIYVLANFFDESPIVSKKYYLNGKKIDPNKPLYFKTAPLGTSTLVVKAKDSFGNVGYATSTFRVVPGRGSCIKDITEAFDRKWIHSKVIFLKLFKHCKDLEDYWDDQDNGNHDHDDEIDRVCREIDHDIKRNDDDDRKNEWGKWGDNDDD